MESLAKLHGFLESWVDGSRGTKRAFLSLRDYGMGKNDVSLSFKTRPGVSYSLRFRHPLQKRRGLFALVDVIDDDPENRWLSVCFYEDTITDPEEKGNVVHQGILGEDGYCFDVDRWDGNEIKYLEKRFDEAYMKALKEAENGGFP